VPLKTLDDSESMRRFAGIELGDDRIPDETTILNFRHLLEHHGLTEAIFADVNAHLADEGITSTLSNRARGHPERLFG
jgi:IS5 family transposase